MTSLPILIALPPDAYIWFACKGVCEIVIKIDSTKT